MTTDHHDALTEAPAPDDLSAHSTTDLLYMVEDFVEATHAEAKGELLGHAIVARDALAELFQRDAETTVYGYCTACREARDECDEDLCCLSCGKDLAPVADHGAEVLTEAFGELDQRIAALEAENARLRIRAEAREAQLNHAQRRLHRLGQNEADMQGVLDALQASGAAIASRWWADFGEAGAHVTVAEGRVAEVDAAMLAVGFYPVGAYTPKGGAMVHAYSTDGDKPWEAEDGAGGAR